MPLRDVVALQAREQPELPSQEHPLQDLTAAERLLLEDIAQALRPVEEELRRRKLDGLRGLLEQIRDGFLLAGGLGFEVLERLGDVVRPLALADEVDEAGDLFLHPSQPGPSLEKLVVRASAQLGQLLHDALPHAVDGGG